MSANSLNVDEIARQVRSTQENPRRLPASWHDPEVAEHMAAWIERNVHMQDRADFIYGASQK